MIRFATSALVLALAASSVALADPPRHDHDRPAERQRDYRDGGRRDFDRRGRDYRPGWTDRGRYVAPRAHYPPPPRYYAPRGYYGHRWHRGEWLPPVYRTRYYYVPDYYRYRVYAPPPGCRWVHHDGDLVLMALATGLVLDVVYDVYR
jgi:Ni/Co efflux regulator RcnB